MFSLFCFHIRLCGYVIWKPSRDLTRPIRATCRFKGLVAYAKCNRDSYESELGFSFLFFGVFCLVLQECVEFIRHASVPWCFIFMWGIFLFPFSSLYLSSSTNSPIPPNLSHHFICCAYLSFELQNHLATTNFTPITIIPLSYHVDFHSAQFESLAFE